MRSASARLYPNLPYILAAAFFVVYSRTLWGLTAIHRSVLLLDGIHHLDVEAFFSGVKVAFGKYSIGAYLLDYYPVRALYALQSLFDPATSFKFASPRLSGWYHCLMGAAGTLIFFRLMEKYVKFSTALFAMTVFGLVPAMSFWSASSSVNMPFLFYVLLSFLSLDRFIRTRSILWAAAIGVFSAFAFVNKEYFGIILLMYPFVFFEGLRRENRSAAEPKALAGAAVALASFLLTGSIVTLLWLDPSVYLFHFKAYLSGDPEVMGEQRYLFWRPRPLLPNLPSSVLELFSAGILSPPCVLLALVGLYFLFVPAKSRMWVVSLSTVPYFLAVPARHDHIDYPYLFPMLPLLAAAVAVGFERLATLKNKWRAAGFILAALALWDIGLWSWYLHADIANDTRIRADAFFRNIMPPRPTKMLSFVQPIVTQPECGATECVNLEPQRLADDRMIGSDADFIMFTRMALADAVGKAMRRTDATDADKVVERLFGKGNYTRAIVFENPRRRHKAQYNMLNYDFFVYAKTDLETYFKVRMRQLGAYQNLSNGESFNHFRFH